MKRFLAVAVSMMLILPGLAFAEIKIITHTVQQPFGGSQSPDDARTAGIARAKREALERFGSYIESTTVVKNAQVDSDEILALTAGVTKAEVVKQKNYTDGDGFGLEITVKVELDTSVLDKSLKRLLQDRNHLKDLKAAREREKQLLARIAELEQQNKQQGKTGKQKEDLAQEFKKTSQGLTAVEWFDKAMALWGGGKYSAPQKAIEYLTQAIRLNPAYVRAYNGRGVACVSLEQYQQGISDFTQAIKLDPSDSSLYTNRGLAHAGLHQHQQAIDDYTQAIKLNPSGATAYYSRGGAYAALGQYQRAINDYTQAIRFEPGLAMAYTDRGAAYYSGLKQHKQAIADYSQAIKLDPDFVALVYYNRGLVYANLKQYQKAIGDYTQAIRLEPSLSVAYYNRGITYLLSGVTAKGCRDLNTACSMGDCKGYEVAGQKGLCK